MDVLGTHVAVDPTLVLICASVALLLTFAVTTFRWRQQTGRRLTAVRGRIEPEMQRIGAQYAGDPVRMRDEKWALQREHDIPKVRQIARIATFLNIVTTIIAAIPILIGIGAYLIGLSHVAAQLDLAGIAFLLLSKAALFVLAFVLIPVVQSLPSTVVGIFLSQWYQERLARRKARRHQVPPGN